MANRIYQTCETLLIEWTPASGPLAGVTLVAERVDTHPQHGIVVVFGRYPNKRSQDVTAIVAGKPDLQALVDELQARKAEQAAARALEVERLKSVSERFLLWAD